VEERVSLAPGVEVLRGLHLPGQPVEMLELLGRGALGGKRRSATLDDKRVSRRPAPRRIVRALRSVTGEMPRSSARRLSGGSPSPGRRSPIPIARPRRSTVSATALPRRTGL
jgi:hypothetical protein